MRTPPSIDIRFYGDLDVFAGKRELRAAFGEPRSVKDLIESLGVPHTEVGLIVTDGRPVGFDHIVHGGERLAVYPPFHEVHVPAHDRVEPDPIPPRFVLDVHLGTLTRRLRLLGFDCHYRTDADDAELARIAVADRRILLTRDRHLLMRRVIVHGYCPRSSDPDEQAFEVLRRYRLADHLDPLTRCVRCNAGLERVEKAAVIDQLPARTRETFDEFGRCTGCGRVYWPGSHLDAVDGFLRRAAELSPAAGPGRRG